MVSFSGNVCDDALATLSENGIIVRIRPAGALARDENRVEDNHPHLICREASERNVSH